MRRTKIFLIQHELDFMDLPLCPEAVDVLDHVVFRNKIDIRAAAESYAKARFKNSNITDPRRKHAGLLTCRAVMVRIMTRELTSSRYEACDLSAAEQISQLKANNSCDFSFVFAAYRHFLAFPKGRCGKARWRA